MAGNMSGNMTGSMNSTNNSTSPCEQGFLGLLDCNSGTALNSSGLQIGAVVAAIGVSLASFGGQTLLFAILRLRLTRIYRPRSYLVPERERVPPAPGGLIGWLYPLFTTTNLTIIQKCGLDAYFFLRYLRMLLKIFLPMSFVLLPILLPINATAGGGQSGLDQLSISNVVHIEHADHLLWAHLILALVVIVWILYVVFNELRGFIRVRQAFLASPQHRLRASATTVLVSGIPRKWLTHEALSGLYDVFPGGIRNIWINRNFDELSNKVNLRSKIAKSLESAETNLIKLCREKHEKAEKRRLKKEGAKSKSKEQIKQDRAAEDNAAEQMAHGTGFSAGHQQHSRHDMEQIANTDENGLGRSDAKAGKNPFFAVGHGLEAFGKGVGKMGGRMVGGVDAGLVKASQNLNRTAGAVNNGGLSGGGFVLDDALFEEPVVSSGPATVQSHEKDLKTVGAYEDYDQQSRPVTNGTDDQQLTQTNHLQNQHQQKMGEASQSPSVSESTLGCPPLGSATRPSGDVPKSPMQIEEPVYRKGFWDAFRIFRNNDASIVLPSPMPHYVDEDEFPLRHDGNERQPKEDVLSKSKFLQKLGLGKQKNVKHKDDEEPRDVYPSAFDAKCDEDQDGEPVWRKYIEPGDRETIRLPALSMSWWPSIPFIGKKVDRIYHLRRELARLNLEIEADQKEPEKFPLLSSAFIQFNHQVAAHMCCQSLSHHVPQQMAPRAVEISPDDVIWDNMSIKWWERLLRVGVATLICAAMIVFYAIPVGFTGLLNNVATLSAVIPWLSWLNQAPAKLISVVEGVLPPLLLGLILALVPIFFGLLVQLQGVPTGSAKQLGVQTWYFTFLFIQVFFVATLAGGLSRFFASITNNPTSVVTSLASSLPKAADYFYSYLTVQSLSSSASDLLQAFSLFKWFIWGPLMDSTARAKWRRQTTLSTITWGTFFPMFTNYAVIGIIYCVIAPLILPFLLLIYGLFWIVYRYNVIYVNQFRQDTGGQLFPVALNQLFVGIYFMELCLIGLFFTSNGVSIAQGVIMVLAMIGTILFQVLLNSAFRPLYQYLPITLEDEAVIRDEEFAKAQSSKFARLRDEELEVVEQEKNDIQEVLRDRERQEEKDDETAIETEKSEIRNRRRSQMQDAARVVESVPEEAGASKSRAGRPWHTRTTSMLLSQGQTLRKAGPDTLARLRYIADGKPVPGSYRKDDGEAEAQQTVGDILYSGFADELEDLTPDDRDLLVRYAFQHSALRARRPVVWIPRDRLGVSDDEIQRAQRMSTVEVEIAAVKKKESQTYIWMSNEGTALDHKGRVVFRRSPPDFSNIDLIAL